MRWSPDGIACPDPARAGRGRAGVGVAGAVGVAASERVGVAAAAVAESAGALFEVSEALLESPAKGTNFTSPECVTVTTFASTTPVRGASFDFLRLSFLGGETFCAWDGALSLGRSP